MEVAAPYPYTCQNSVSQYVSLVALQRGKDPKVPASPKRIFFQVIAQHPGCLVAQHKLAVLYTQGELYGLHPNPEKGIDAWENVYKLDPSHKAALNELGKAA
jgi:hypothetical protein